MFMLNQSMALLPVALFGLLALPTMAMGATLPVLIRYLNNQGGSLGDAVSKLYFANTLGSALAALITVYVLLFYFDLDMAIQIAASINILVGATIFFWTRVK